METVAETVSTNADLAERARTGAPDGLWLRAASQSGGRGRDGRIWQSPPGNLYCSTLVRPLPGEAPMSGFSFLAALALHDAVRSLCPGLSPLLKWPNDVLVGGRKLAGILLEAGAGPGNGAPPPWIIVGFGVNCAVTPSGLDRPATSLADLGCYADPAGLLDALSAVFADWRARWRREGFSTVRAAWLAAADGQGAPMRVQLPDRVLEGRFAGLADDGALQLALAGGELERIYAGDVFRIDEGEMRHGSGRNAAGD